MKLNTIVTSIICLLIIFSMNVSAQANYKLEYKFKKGNDYKYRNVTNSDVTQQVSGQEMKIQVSASAIQHFYVDDVTGGNIVLIATADSVIVSTKMPMRDTTMHLDNLADKKLKILLSPSGKIVKKEFVDSSMDQMTQQYQQIINQSIRFVKLPENEISEGRTWSSEDVDTVSIMGSQILTKANLDYTLGGKEERNGHQCVKISFTGKSSNEGKAKMMGMDLYIEGTGKTSGDVYFDPEQGIVIYSEILSDNNMTMAATGQQKMIIPITQTSKLVQTYIEK